MLEYAEAIRAYTLLGKTGVRVSELAFGTVGDDPRRGDGGEDERRTRMPARPSSAPESWCSAASPLRSFVAQEIKRISFAIRTSKQPKQI